jgi:ribonuclease-3
MSKRRTREPANSAKALEALLAYTFVDSGLLRLALTHRSFAYEERGGEPQDVPYPRHRNPPGTDNEQLEFLGDAILGLLVSEALFKSFRDASEGDLTRMRSVLVSRKRMADFGAALHLADYVLLGKSAEQNGAREKPALMANAAEAVLAAMYLDSADGRQAAHDLVHKLLIAPELPTLRDAISTSSADSAFRDHKTLLQEKVQALAQTEPVKLRYVDIAADGPPHQRIFTVEAQIEDANGTRTLATASGGSKKEAQQGAAEKALAQWVAPA